MNRKKWIIFIVAFAMIAGCGGVLMRLKANQRLGSPGVKTAPLVGSQNLEVLLPENVLDYTSQVMTQQELAVKLLPKDTSFGGRFYHGPEGFDVQANVVLMGRDRTSMHKPQFCLEGGGWRIDSGGAQSESVHVEKPFEYDLPMIKLMVTRQVENQGQPQTYRGIFLYWFVADGALSADPSGVNRLKLSAWQMLTRGELQRWAYVYYFSACAPGQEEATLARMKKLIAASVPEFQLTPKPKSGVANASL